MTQGRTYKPKAPVKIHWEALGVYRQGEKLEGEKKREALLGWKRGVDPSVYCVPFSYGPQNIDWTNFK